MYEIIYGPWNGRAEQIRLLLAELQQQWTETRAPRGNEARSAMSTGPGSMWFRAVPILDDDGFRLSQGPVILSYLARKHGIGPEDLRGQARADAVALGAEDLRINYFRLFYGETERKQKRFLEEEWKGRWLSCFEELLEANGSNGFFVGDHLTHADVAVFDALDASLIWVPGTDLEGFERIGRFYADFRERPRIAAYLASDLRPRK